MPTNLRRSTCAALSALWVLSGFAPAASAQEAGPGDPVWVVLMQTALGVNYGRLVIGENHDDGSSVGIMLGSLNLTRRDEGGTHTGMRLSGLLGATPSVVGLDVGLVNVTTDDMQGVQVGMVNNSQDATGVQCCTVNWTDESFDGFQFGVVNVVNGKSRSVQAGLINSAGSLKGVQFGLLNLNASGPLLFFPLINVGW